ncbi:hypothetical protein GGX14DRAFT_545058 [Mycena pura]|uniref:PIN domain-containing protein n=1 Tax=Mycena pura TaxID=153505 RepID=A0AAD6V163_9AGAR|nr:hypothetical protein GGX14DRAFT_545058 [Mycena pura]
MSACASIILGKTPSYAEKGKTSPVHTPRLPPFTWEFLCNLARTLAIKQEPSTHSRIPDNLAMSRALGAAFLNHQVEQLEKSAASRNWRSVSPNPQQVSKRTQQPGSNATTAKAAPRKKNAGVLVLPKNTPPVTAASARRSMEDEKDADVVVVDASVLVHALHQVKKWCRDGRAEVVIVPLEALNTLDLLKKGTSPIAQRARAASRILEAQVGTNPRIRVQQDNAFVPWDSISFAADPVATSEASTASPAPGADSHDIAPEWTRRTVCCARWEIDAAVSPSDAGKESQAKTETTPLTVRLAVLRPDAAATVTADGAANALSKHEPRAAGTLVTHWAARAQIAVLHVAPSTTANAGESDANAPRRPRSGTQTKRGSAAGGGGGKGGGSLVERPPAALALEGTGNGGPRVVRVLARGERLDSGA